MKKLFVMLVMLAAMNASGQWVQKSSGIGNDKDVSALVSAGNNIYAGFIVGTYPNSNGYVYISSDDGANWSSVSRSFDPVNSIAICGNTLFVGTRNGYGSGTGQIWASSNYGVNWSILPFASHGVLSLAPRGNNLYAGTSDSGAYLSTNFGLNWSHILTINNPVSCIWINNNNIFVSADSNIYCNIYFSSNNGSTWRVTTVNAQHFRSFANIGDNIFAGTVNGVYCSSNDGLNWVQSGLSDTAVTDVIMNENNIFAGTWSYGVYLSTNNGLSWIRKNQGFQSVQPIVNKLLIKNEYIFAGSYLYSIWRRSLSEIIGIQNISTELPFMYTLNQNYPNPFNPTTSIEFSISKKSAVKVLIYDDMGRELQTLVNETLTPGYFHYKFDGAGFPSGVYFYKLLVNGLSETKKMLMIK